MSKYQHNYASNRPQMYDKSSRETKAIRIVKLLQDHYGKKNLKLLNLLDVGASTGIIDNQLSKYFKSVTGIDIDVNAIKFANKNFKRKNLKFSTDDAMKLSFGKNTFDVIICAQIYEHVPNPQKLMDEIYRVLKPSGSCYFAALNKWWPIEPHYNLPFLSWMPKKAGNIYVKLLKKSEKYHETLKSYWELKKLTKKFKVIEYTDKILNNPKKYGYEKLSMFPVNILAKVIAPFNKFLVPTFFWLLVKKEN